MCLTYRSDELCPILTNNIRTIEAFVCCLYHEQPNYTIPYSFNPKNIESDFPLFPVSVVPGWEPPLPSLHQRASTQNETETPLQVGRDGVSRQPAMATDWRDHLRPQTVPKAEPDQWRSAGRYSLLEFSGLQFISY